jgi:predicted nucleotidyltransferase
MITTDDIRRVARRIGEAVDAERVILFGSHARGDATADSDVDLMIVAESDLPRHKRSRRLYSLFRPYPFGMDLLVYTPEEVEKGKRSSVSFVSTVLKEGRTVYARRDGDRQAVGGKSQE